MGRAVHKDFVIQTADEDIKLEVASKEGKLECDVCFYPIEANIKAIRIQTDMTAGWICRKCIEEIATELEKS